jgi:hypothetical protein
MRRNKHLIRTAKVFLIVAREYQLSTKGSGFIKLRRTLGLLRRNFGLLRRITSVSQAPIQEPSDSRNGTVCFILGNGPSLNADIAERLDIFRTGDCFCVNEFAETDLYQKIQPKYYVFADPAYWDPVASERFVSMRNELYKKILSKTSWPLTILVPFAAKELFESVFFHSPNICLSFYNTSLLPNGEKILTNILYDLGLVIPLPQNVLISALFLSLRLGYKKIILLGADHSWHETIALDDANRVCVKDRHFYNKDAKLIPWSRDGTEENIWTMGAVFHALARMFEGYWEIAEYAKHHEAQIYNASSVTYIDAFKRKPIADLLVELKNDVQKIKC